MHWFILHCELWLIQIWLNSNMPKFFSFDMVLVKRSFSIIWTFRSSHQRCSMKKGVLGNFPKFTGKHLCRVYFLIKLQARPANLLRRRLWHMCFPVNFEKFLRTPFLQNTSGGLLLDIVFILYFFGFLQVYTTRRIAPKFSFGIRHSEYIAPLITEVY